MFPLRTTKQHMIELCEHYTSDDFCQRRLKRIANKRKFYKRVIIAIFDAVQSAVSTSPGGKTVAENGI